MCLEINKGLSFFSAKLMLNAEIHSPNKSILERMFKNLEIFKANANFVDLVLALKFR